MRLSIVIIGLLVSLAVHAPASAGPTMAGTIFTYQALLRDQGLPISGNVDARFRLFDDPTDGVQIATELVILDLQVTDGLFEVDLDFGPAFDGSERWLEIDVRYAGAPEYTTLTPRHPIRPAPMALFALSGLDSPWQPAAGGIRYDGIAGINADPLGTFPLNVESDTDFRGIVIAPTDNTLSQGLFFRNSGSNFTWSITRRDAGSNTADLVVAGGSGIAAADALTERIRIRHNGRIGIGTPDPKTPIALLLNGANGQAGLTQNFEQGTKSLEFTTEDPEGNPVTRMSLGGGQTHPNFRLWKLIDGVNTPFFDTNDVGVGFGDGAFAPSTEELRIRTDDQVYAVRANNFLEGGTGVLGVANLNTGNGIGVEGRSDAAGGTGVHGHANAETGINYGVVGETDSPAGYGVWGQSNADGGTAIYGDAFDANDFGVFSNGRLGATGTKSFMIDHPLDPENWILLHYSSEAPEPMNEYSGTATLDHAGTAWIALPDYFSQINADPRYQLTPIGAAMPNLHIASRIQNNRFLIAGGVAGMEVSWQVTARRNDLFVRINGAPSERQKNADQRGRYLRPDLYGLSSDSSMHRAPVRTGN